MTIRSPRPTSIARRRAAMLLAGLAGVTALAAGCGGSSGSGSTSAGASSPPAPAATTSGAVVSTAKTPLGTILVDSKGKTIYVFAIDKPGQSKCMATCLAYWPAVTAPAAMTSVSGVTAKLGVLDRPEGTKQLTVAGYPVYTFAGDSGPGKTTGQGKNLSGGLWWVVSPTGAWIKAMPAAHAPAPSTSSGGGYGY
jgi:predicted lipoprotein with Yx(FWY)xxD motif